MLLSGAGQDWTGSTTLIVTGSVSFFIKKNYCDIPTFQVKMTIQLHLIDHSYIFSLNMKVRKRGVE